MFNIKNFSLANKPELDEDTFYNLLLHLSSDELEKKWPIHIQDIVFFREVDSSRGYPQPCVTVYFHDQDKGNLAFKESAKKETLIYKTSPVRSTKELIEGTISILTLRLAQGEAQDNVAELLKYVAEEIKEIPDKKILEIIYRYFSDEDAIDHPSIVVYYWS